MGITSVHDLSDEIPECVPWDRLVAIRVCLLEVVLEEHLPVLDLLLGLPLVEKPSLFFVFLR